MKTILIAVSGMSPAIITETLWALSGESPAVVPDDVVIITTTKGERDIQGMLLTAREDWGGKKVWEQMRADIFKRTGLPARSKRLQLKVEVIDLPDEETGVRRRADDLRTRADNDEAADFIVRVVDDCATDDTHVIASIAGGRKTMGALLYAAMSLRAKETDRVTHVLVSEPFEFCKAFFYPQQPVQSLTATPFGQPPLAVQAKDAKVEMADIQFVPLRNKFTELMEPRRTFAGLVDCYSRAERTQSAPPPVVSLNVRTEILTVNGREIALSGREIAVAAFLLHRARRGLTHIPTQPLAATLINKEFLDPWRARHIALPHVARIAETLDAGDFARTFDALRKKLAAKGLNDVIPHLCPKGGRCGFDLKRE